MPDKCVATLATPIGVLVLQAHGGLLTQVTIGVEADAIPPEGATGHHPILQQAKHQLLEYFAGKRQEFDLPLRLPTWPAFSLRVLAALRAIPYGEVRSYGELARLAGSPRAARAVGQVMAANPLPIIIPCHRVVAARGLLGGYSGGGGLATKSWLLDLERQTATQQESAIL